MTDILTKLYTADARLGDTSNRVVATNAPVSAQIELMPSGDFIARSNLVERVYRRVNPDDWDDDGGPNGGRVRFEISSGAGKIGRVSGRVLPVEQDIGPGMRLDFTTVYEGKLPSASANDIVVTTTFTENTEDAEPASSQARLTSVKVTLESTSFSLDNCPNRHIRGIGESVNCKWTPSVSGLSFQTRSGAVCTGNYSNSRDVTCPFHGC